MACELRAYTCPLCGAAWKEPAPSMTEVNPVCPGYRVRGTCPGCGAGEPEMFRAASLKLAKLDCA